MSKKKLLSFLIVFILAIMIGCSSEDEAEGKTEPERDEEPEEEEVVEMETNDEEEKEEERASADEEQYIEGKVLVKEDENVIRVEAETNVTEGALMNVHLTKAFGVASFPVAVGSESQEINDDGTVSIDYPVEDSFFETNHGEYIEVQVEVKDNPTQKAFGEQGEDFTGPFVYQFERPEHEKRLYAPVYIQVGGGETEYAIETPDREPLADDYGETDIWVDAEIVDNDHRFIYIKGKSNLIEGLELDGKYYSDEDAKYPQVFRNTKMFVEPDGTFLLPIRYESITTGGYIEIKGTPQGTHRTKEQILKKYGEKFENLNGDVVKEVDDHQEILITIDNEGLGIDTPEDSLITEDDGELKIQVPDDVLFDFDKSDLKGEAKNTLNDVIAILEDLDEGEDIQIHGHTDNEGEPDYNLNLSEERAASVEKYLTKHGDLNHLNITKEGFGETKPVESNEDEKGRERNRRVEIIFNKK